MINKPCFLISCEHATAYVPPEYQSLFKAHDSVLATHRAYDLGASEVAHSLAETLGCSAIYGQVSRLVIDLNRSLSHRGVWSSFSRSLSAEQKKDLIHGYYLPYREKFASLVTSCLAQYQTVIHLSIHSFTPILGEQVRQAEIGLLYDPAYPEEKMFAEAWKKHLSVALAEYRIRMNYPYQGKSDGFTNTLRKTYQGRGYIGIELEMNQAVVYDLFFKKSVVETVIRMNERWLPEQDSNL